jgi:hypothetical protein
LSSASSQSRTTEAGFLQRADKIFRHHALQITHSRHLTGNFNAHLMDALFLFLDEAFWGGDKQGEGVLKTLITEDCVQIEPKGVDSFPMLNRLKIMMASNNDWVVPATEDERRYFVLDVSDAKVGDRTYWRELHAALDGGEVAAFLDCLLTHDLNGFEIRDVPHTKGLNRQKLVGADSVTSFWLDCLRVGSIVGTDSPDWPEKVSKQLLHDAYTKHARDHGARHLANGVWMGRRLGELWKGCKVGDTKTPADDAGQRWPAYALDSLTNHRTAFAKAMNIGVGEMDCHPEDKPHG